MDETVSIALEQLLRRECTLDVVRDIDRGASAQPLWQQIEAAGFADALVPEEEGGAGLALADAFFLFELCGRYAVPVPLAETLLVRALLSEQGVARPYGSITLSSGAAIEGGVGCECVRGGALADWVLVSVGAEVLLLPVATAEAVAAGARADASLRWTEVAVREGQRVPGSHDLQTLQACAYAVLLAGAMKSVLERTLRYAKDRRQFGRAIGKFQVIQQQLAVIAEHAFAARMAAQIACNTPGVTPVKCRVAVGKARASEAAVEVAALSHSIHGAIGFTAEFDLQIYTRRLYAWRQAAGSESYWHGVLGAGVVDRHAGLALDFIRALTDLEH